MKHRLFRGVVLLFLVYTAVEFAFPQFCGERAFSIVGSTTAASVRESGLQLSQRDSSESPRPDNDLPDNDDCFCCCGHVMPSPPFVNPQRSAMVALSDQLDPVSIPDASLGAPYHPPRSA